MRRPGPGRPPLNTAGGSAAVVATKLPDVDLVRLVRLAARRGTSRSAVTRELIRLALDQAEQPAAENGAGNE